MFYQLPPVGHPIALSASGDADEFPDRYFAPYNSRYYASGTAALAAAIIAAASRKKVGQPEVILPAYGCPDLVSAVVYAGAKPVAVDFEPERPWMNLGQLEQCITGSTVAVVAVHLFGIPERMNEIRDVAARSGIVLIEDSAQAFPSVDTGGFWSGDMVVLSFGRGKPVSMLGGGAVLAQENKYLDIPGQAASSKCWNPRWLFWLKAALYNSLISPRMYWIPQAMPFLKLGQTRYRTLESIRPLDDLRVSLLAENIHRFRRYEPEYRRLRNAYADMIAETDGIVDLPAACGLSDNHRLLRYPVLVRSRERGEIYNAMKKKGLGPSLMYPSRLNSLECLEGILDQAQSTPAADDFAARVLTLPLHQHVSQKDLFAMRSLLGGRY